jgi:hypothetical protein
LEPLEVLALEPKGQLEALGSEALGQQVLEYKVAQEALEASEPQAAQDHKVLLAQVEDQLERLERLELREVEQQELQEFLP